MSIYTIGDLHLSFHENKPMSIFGQNWEGHEEKIKKDWLEKVKEKDLVILPGDFSWSTYLKDTYEDFKYLNSLPGKKLLLKGNHDYWWTTLKSMRDFLEKNNFSNIDFIYNNAYNFEKYIFAGTRGWSMTDEKEDEKFIKRESLRLEMSLKEAMKIKKERNLNEEIIVFMHYPPITNNQIHLNEVNLFIKVLKKYDVKRCYYGHLHGNSIKEAVNQEYLGIQFKLVSADGLDFKLLKIE